MFEHIEHRVKYDEKKTFFILKMVRCKCSFVFIHDFHSVLTREGNRHKKGIQSGAVQLILPFENLNLITIFFIRDEIFSFNWHPIVHCTCMENKSSMFSF